MKQSRLKSPVVWASLLALVGCVSKNIIGWEIPGWDEIVTLVLSAAAAFGVLNNPTERDGF